MGYNSHFDKSEGMFAWLSRDTEALKPRETDTYANFIFTVSAYKDLFTMLDLCNRKSWFESYPTDLPTLIVSGDEDPVGQYGKGPKIVYKKLLMAGAKGISLKIYSGARHELFLETNRAEVFADLLVWLNSVTDKA
jgi:alpha-beta hydrolase superfamily lysophospholipase